MCMTRTTCHHHTYLMVVYSVCWICRFLFPESPDRKVIQQEVPELGTSNPTLVLGSTPKDILYLAANTNIISLVEEYGFSLKLWLSTLGRFNNLAAGVYVSLAEAYAKAP